MPTPYEKKFENFIKLLEKTKDQPEELPKAPKVVIVAYPWVIGDNYEEMVESLNRLADAGLVLAIAESKRG